MRAGGVNAFRISAVVKKQSVLAAIENLPNGLTCPELCLSARLQERHSICQTFKQFGFKFVPAGCRAVENDLQPAVTSIG